MEITKTPKENLLYDISDAGEYKMSVVLNSGVFASSATAYTNLTVIGMNKIQNC